MNVPEGYYLVEDENYTISLDDRFYYECWNKFGIGFASFHPDSVIVGNTIKTIRNKIEYKGIIIATKGKPKPRFECSKPYPYGY